MIRLIAIFFILNAGQMLYSREIRLGVLLPMTGRWPIGRRIAAAVPMAINDIINDATLLPDCNITYEIADSACVPEEGLRAMVAFQTVDLFIGPACSVVTEPAALLAKIWNKPMITYAASSNKFIDKEIYSTLGTITAYARRSELYTPKFVFEMLRVFNWTVCSILCSSEVEWKVMADKIRRAVEPEVKVSLFESYDNKNPQFENLLVKSKQVTRVLIVLCYINEVAAIMKAAQDLGMTNGDYAFITLDLNTDVFYTDGHWSGNQGTGSSFPQVLNGVIDLSVYRPEIGDEFKHNYSSAINQLHPSIRGNLYPRISWYASLLYDAVHLYALAVNETLSSGYDPTNTSQVLMRMFNTRFHGKSGHVLMENGTRVPQFVVGNLRNGSYKLVANRTNLLKNGSGPVLHELRLPAVATIVWPGGSRDIPRSIPLCGFDGELCREKQLQGNGSNDNLSVILGVSGACMLLLAVFVLLVFLRRRKKEQENLYKKWIINLRDVTPSDDYDDNPCNLNSATQVSHRASTTSIVVDSTRPGEISQGQFNQRTIFKGIFQGKAVLVKRVCDDAFHLTDDMKTEIRQACEIRHVNMNPYLGVCIEFPDVCIVSEYCAKGSLQDILLNDAFKLDWTFRMSFASDIARGMEELHKSAIGCHGNLKSTNVVVDRYWICKVTDYGLQLFRQSGSQDDQDTPQRHSALLWTAPEYLRSTSGHRKFPLADVYSYGIILQEIALREKPFSTSLISPKEILYYVRKGLKPHCRPHVPPDNASKAYMDLMKMCWDEGPERRPTFSGILKMLKKTNNGKCISVIDNMLCMMEKYTNNLESVVNERTKQLQTEKSKTDELLYRMLPRSIAEQLKSGLDVKAELYDQVTIFYSAIVEFTSITSESSPMQVINLLNDLHSLFDTVMTRHDVYKVETTGDSYLVVSGLPERNGNKHAGEIANLSLRLLTYLKNFKISHLQGRTLQFRIGIHTGPCVAGVVGLKKPRYEIFGESVDVTRHLELAGTAQQIHVSSACKRVLDQLGGFVLEERGNVMVKGLGETTTYFLKGN